MSEQDELNEQIELDEKLVEVGRFLDPAEAHMAEGLLRSAGIECFLQGENANAVIPMAFRTRLRVKHEDQEAAEELLAQPELAEGEEVE